LRGAATIGIVKGRAFQLRMIDRRNMIVTSYIRILVSICTFALIGLHISPTAAQQAAPAEGAAPTGVRLQVADGSRAVYRVREQLVGINFPNDAAGGTNAVSGTLVIRPDGSIDSSQSKLTVDLRSLKSDQDLRDGFLQGERGLNTAKFPTAEFVPKRAVGLPWPFPSKPPLQAGFQLIGDMTVYGKTTEVTWNTVATFSNEMVAGRATTQFPFAQFGIPKPQIARLMSVDDTINLDIEFRLRKTPL
jgi:polyisoprenoid-binding protein YceI